MATKEDFYKLLNVERNASDAEKAQRRDRGRGPAVVEELRQEARGCEAEQQ